jgi:DNA polymerase-3 subunit alpha
MQLLQEVKRTQTRKIGLITMPQFVTPEVIDFLADNIQKHPGKAEIYCQLIDRDEELMVKMHTFTKHVEMNDELAQFLSSQPDFDVWIDTFNK